MIATLDRSVLVLNRNFAPVGVRPFRRALSKLCTTYEGTEMHKAVVLDPETYATWTWSDWSKLNKSAPEIIVLSRYADLPTHKIPFSRRAIYKRDRFTCNYCGCQPGPEELTIDHILPRSRGGLSTWENTTLACVACNKRKADKLPSEAGMKLRKQPKKPTFMPVVTQQRFASWEVFLGKEAYWNVPLAEE